MEKTEKKLTQEFAIKMFKKLQLRHDRYTPMSWKTLDLKRLLWLLQGELDELRSRIEQVTPGSSQQIFFSKVPIESVKDNAIDIANYALFIHEII